MIVLLTVIFIYELFILSSYTAVLDKNSRAFTCNL